MSEAASWAEITWGQFRSRRAAYIALWGVAGLFTLATFAPLIASNQPLLWKAGGEWSSPWLQSLFDRNFYSSSVDIVFNALLLPGVPLLGLVAVASRMLATRPAGARRQARRRIALGALGLWLAGCAALLAFPTSRPYRDWEVEQATLEAKGEEVVAILPLIPWSQRDGTLKEARQAPSAAHPFGTDGEGRDTFTRLLYGTRISLTIGVFAVAIYCSVGTVVGAVAGYFGGAVDLALQGVIEVVMCIPSMFLVLAAAAFIRDRTIFDILLIIAAVSWTTPARLVRAEFLRLRALDFVTAAEAVGYSRRTIIFREVLPNALGPVLVTATFGVASAILVESGMSFLGLGDASAASWGQMLASGRNQDSWLLINVAGSAILVTVVLLNLVGEGVRDALDPKLRQ